MGGRGSGRADCPERRWLSRSFALPLRRGGRYRCFGEGEAPAEPRAQGDHVAQQELRPPAIGGVGSLRNCLRGYPDEDVAARRDGEREHPIVHRQRLGRAIADLGGVAPAGTHAEGSVGDP